MRFLSLALRSASAAALVTTLGCSAETTRSNAPPAGTSPSAPGPGAEGGETLAEPVHALALGSSFTCALTEGTVKCWGIGSSGQTGPSGSPEANPSPLEVPVVGRATAIAAGASHACVLLEGGTVSCWGNLLDGTIGHEPRAWRVKGLRGVTALAVGAFHACAVVEGGAVACWGHNARGQLGNGTKTPSAAPVAARGLRDVRALSLGASHSCALTSEGGVSCWGNNASGAAGAGAPEPRVLQGDYANAEVLTPRAIEALSGPVRSLAAGGQWDGRGGDGANHTCALLEAGDVACWGHYGVTATSLAPASVPGLGSGIVGLATGPTHACAETREGRVKCWGWNAHGALGNGNTEDLHDAPVEVVGL